MRQLQSNERYDVPIHSRILFRVYADSRPHVLQTRKLQKGVVVVRDGVELVEEGLGMGVPVCRYENGTRFSLSANTYVDDSKTNPSIVKVYEMNGSVVRKLGNAVIRKGTGVARILRVLETGYQRLQRLGPVPSLILDMASLVGVRKEYAESGSRGRVAVTYDITETGLWIRADISELVSERLESILFANELGGRWFSRYADSSGARLEGGKIGAWQRISAQWASLGSPRFQVVFTVHRPKGWMMVRGREVARNRISWSGLDLVSKEIPKGIGYRIDVSGGAVGD